MIEMDELLEQARTIWEGEIDFEGQRLAELISTALLTAAGIIAFFVGYAKQDIYAAMYIGLAGTALTFVVVVPPWPFFNQHPLPFLPARRAAAKAQKDWKGPGVDLGGIGGIEVDGKRVG